MFTTFADAAKAVTFRAADPVPRRISPGTIRNRPDSAGTVNSIKSSGEVVPPYSIVNFRSVVSLFTAYSQISSVMVDDVPVAWIVVPVEDVAATFIILPPVEPLRSSLLKVAIVSPN